MTLGNATMKQWPFPHAVIDGLWPNEWLGKVASEFPDDGWKSYQNPNEYKMESGRLGPETQKLFDFLGSDSFCLDLSLLTGIPDLAMETVGGGYHLIPPGGRLAVHTDFNRSPATGRYRRVNFLIYLNKDWTDPGGHLELWPEPGPERDRGESISIAPEWNRTAIFLTSHRSWHGHPVPANTWRRSVAAYYYTEAPPDDFDFEQSTVWMS